MAGTILVQFPPASNVTIERIQVVEDAIIDTLDECGGATVDGHDFGMYSNIFIFPDEEWEPSLSAILKCVELVGASGEVLVIKRNEAEEYEVVHPKGFKGEFEQC